MNPKPIIIGAAAVAAAYFLLKPDGLLSNLFNSQAGGSAEGGGASGDSGGSPYYRLTDEQDPAFWQQDPKPDPTPAPSPTPDQTPGQTPDQTPSQTAPTPTDTQPVTANPNRPSYVDTIENIGTVAIAAGGTAWAAKEILGGGRGTKLLEVAKDLGRKGADILGKVARNPTAQKLTIGLAAGYGVKKILDSPLGAERAKAEDSIDWLKTVANNTYNYLSGKGFDPVTAQKPSMGFGGSWAPPPTPGNADFIGPVNAATSQPATTNPNRPSATAYTTAPGSTGTSNTFTDTKSGGSITVSPKIAAAINAAGSVRYSSSPSSSSNTARSSPSSSSNTVRSNPGSNSAPSYGKGW